MKSRCLHALALCAASFVACKTGGETAASKRAIGLDPTLKIAEVDGKTITYGDLQSDKEIGPKLRQAEVKALSDLYGQRRGHLDDLIDRQLLEEQAKAKGKTLEEWFKTSYPNPVTDPTDAEATAIYVVHKT